MADKKKPKSDRFMKRMNRLLEDSNENITGEGASDDDRQPSSSNVFTDGLKKIGDVGRKICSVAKAIWSSIGAVSGFYKNQIWDRFAYKKDGGGESSFSKKRASTVVALTTAFALAAGTLATAIPEGIDILATGRTNIAYLHTPRTAAVDNKYSVKGCETQDKCDTGDVVYYNIESSIAKHIWSLFNKGSLYVPKRLIGTIAPDSNNKCEVKIFGTFGDFFEKQAQQLDKFPDLLDSSCVRVDDQGNPMAVKVTPAFGDAVSSAPVASQIIAPAHQSTPAVLSDLPQLAP